MSDPEESRREAEAEVERCRRALRASCDRALAFAVSLGPLPPWTEPPAKRRPLFAQPDAQIGVL